MRRHAFLLLLPLLVIGVGACSAGNGTATSGERSGRQVLLGEDIRNTTFRNALDAVQSLRPRWLATRGRSSFQVQPMVQVYVDGSRRGGPAMLREILAENIESIRYIDGLSASSRWGLDHGEGVIYVTTRI